ncbi:hypothetical protein HNR46_000366 [Haloferula luteola]|uniref:DUF2292 domain-containing protein n=1 Tax=Haloferula luteola TaxID=595692 RepID=A0A840UWP5_9BACT|nr:YezD family protein [Haloferula luteola]MBB5350145.1 hypothetical protein [Haloferula luteola]
MKPKTDASPSTTLPADSWLEVVREKVSRLQFGSVQVTVHDGRVTQVESIERTRFPQPGRSQG